MKEGSAFDEYDRENGYINEETQEEAWRSYGKALDPIALNTDIYYACKLKFFFASSASSPRRLIIFEAEEVAKTLKTNVIQVAGKEYESGKIGRKKYRLFREVYNDLPHFPVRLCTLELPQTNPLLLPLPLCVLLTGCFHLP